MFYSEARRDFQFGKSAVENWLSEITEHLYIIAGKPFSLPAKNQAADLISRAFAENMETDPLNIISNQVLIFNLADQPYKLKILNVLSMGSL